MSRELSAATLCSHLLGDSGKDREERRDIPLDITLCADEYSSGGLCVLHKGVLPIPAPMPPFTCILGKHLKARGQPNLVSSKTVNWLAVYSLDFINDKVRKFWPADS